MSTLFNAVVTLVTVAAIIMISVEGLAASSSTTRPMTTTTTNSNNNNNINNNAGGNSRRAFVAGSGSAAIATAFIGMSCSPFPANAEQVLGRGLDASLLDEASISYKDFLGKLTKGEVVFVEFMAPDGDAAYATLKFVEETVSTEIVAASGEGSEEGKQPITTTSTTSTTVEKKLRIGEGYPIELRDGISSPLFAIKAVKNAGVPYKFTVKGMEKYSSSQ